MRKLIRSSAFFTKEIAEVFRQPRMILTLIVGPFLILVLFGVGYRTANPPVRTLFVVPAGSSIGGNIQQYAKDISPAVTYAGSTQDQAAALGQLHQGKVDLVTVLPANPEKDVLNNKQAPIISYYNEVNPIQVDQVQYISQIFAAAVNRDVLEQVISELQAAALKAGSAISPGQTSMQQALQQLLREGRTVTPAVLVQPFTADAKPAIAKSPTPEQYFAPAVIILLLQHLAVTLGALSIVRERTLGTFELFRVSPLSAGETLAGKYVSYFIFTAIIAALLAVLMVFGLGVPMAGSWFRLGGAIAAMLFASLGWGFLISTFSKNESQAVQYSMILLLTSFFFSGFVLSLNTLVQPVRVISRLMPATYGIALLQDVMFRGIGLNRTFMESVLGLGVALLVLAWLLLGRRLRQA